MVITVAKDIQYHFGPLKIQGPWASALLALWVIRPCAQGPYVAARAGVEPTTLRLKVTVSTKAPPRPTNHCSLNVLSCNLFASIPPNISLNLFTALDSIGLLRIGMFSQDTIN